MPDEPASSAAESDVDAGYTSPASRRLSRCATRSRTRYETSIGAAELDAESPEGHDIEEQYQERQRAAAERLAQIRESMRDER